MCSQGNKNHRDHNGLVPAQEGNSSTQNGLIQVKHNLEREHVYKMMSNKH